MGRRQYPGLDCLRGKKVGQSNSAAQFGLYGNFYEAAAGVYLSRDSLLLHRRTVSPFPTDFDRDHHRKARALAAFESRTVRGHRALLNRHSLPPGIIINFGSFFARFRNSAREDRLSVQIMPKCHVVYCDLAQPPVHKIASGPKGRNGSEVLRSYLSKLTAKLRA